MPLVTRGFTGHEHLDGLRLIDMKGRLYDPELGRFLSPDNYIQSPYDPQNYNRYSYCLNNPLKYTDPNGESWEQFFYDPITFGLGNLLVHGLRGDIKSLCDGFKYFGQGFLTGASLSVTCSLAPCIPIVGSAFQAYMSGNALISTGVMALGMTSGWKRGFYTGDWSTFTNSLELMLGNYYIDENAGFWEGVGQGFSRHTRESLQTTIGHGYSQVRNLVGIVDRVDFMAGATYATAEQSGKGNGVTLGNYININIKEKIGEDFDNWVISNPLYMHEYGHTIDSREYGQLYLFTIGWSSLNSARTSRDVAGRNNHKWFWTELRANNHASRYFQKHYSVDWTEYTDFEKGSYYPLVAPILTKQQYRR
jgi:RHS repeat-associated protein